MSRVMSMQLSPCWCCQCHRHCWVHQLV